MSPRRSGEGHVRMPDAEFEALMAASSDIVPSPSWPHSFKPQHCTAPRLLRSTGQRWHSLQSRSSSGDGH
jgi:hypothetical protein